MHPAIPTNRHVAVRKPPAQVGTPSVPAVRDARWSPFLLATTVLLLTYVWRFQDAFPFLAKLQLVTLGSLAAIGFFLIGAESRRLPLVSRHKVFRITIFLLVLMIPSTLFGIFPTQSLDFVRQDHVKTVLLAVMLMAGLRGRRDIERLAVVHIIGASGLCYWVIRYGRMEDGRLLGAPYYDANDIGYLIICTLPLCLYLLRFTGPATRMLILAALPAMFVTFVKTGSRGGFLGLIAVGTFLLIKFTALSRKARITAISVGAASLLLFAGEQYWEFIHTLLNPTEDYNWAGNAETGRMEVWKRGMWYMVTHPVFGVGPFNFFTAEGLLSERGQLQELGHGFKWSAPHNSFVQIGAELGVTGLVAFLMLLHAGFKAAYRRTPTSDDPAAVRHHALGQALAATIIGYVVAGFFLSQGYSAMLYVLLGTIVAYDLSRPGNAPSGGSQPATASTPVRRLPQGRGGKSMIPRR